MKLDKLKDLFLFLRKWERQNEDIIGRPVRTKHFIEDLGLIIHCFEEEGFDKKLQESKKEYFPKRLRRMFGIKKKELVE